MTFYYLLYGACNEKFHEIDSKKLEKNITWFCNIFIFYYLLNGEFNEMFHEIEIGKKHNSIQWTTINTTCFVEELINLGRNVDHSYLFFCKKYVVPKYKS